MYRMVDCGTWDDPWFESLHPKGKLFFLYLLTNPRSTSCGAYEITTRKMAFETGLDQSDVEGFLEAWAPKVQWFPEHNIVFLKNFYRRQTNSDKVRVNAVRIVSSYPVEVQRAIAIEYPELIESPDTLSIPYAYPTDKQDRDVTETETETNPPLVPPAGGEDPPPEEPKASKEKRATRLPVDWELSETLRAWTRQELGWSDEEVTDVSQRFADYWHSVTTRKVDWDLTWKNWARRENDKRPKVRLLTNTPQHDEAMAAWLKVAQELQQPASAFPDGAMPKRIYQAVQAIGGMDAIDVTNGFHRRDFMVAYRELGVAS